MLSVHTHPAVEAGVSGIRGAGLMDLLSTGTGAHGRGLHRHRHQTHGPTIHHCGRVPNVQEAGAAARAAAP